MTPPTHKFRLTHGLLVLQLFGKRPSETRPIRQHAIKVSLSKNPAPKIRCGASLIPLLRFCTVQILTAIMAFSIDAGSNTSASLKKICRAGPGPLLFILKI